MALHTIDPELFMDDEFNELSDKAKLLYIGLVALADDQGRIRCHLQLLTSKLFMLDRGAKLHLRELLDGLKEHRFILLYEVDGKEYIQIRDWWQQQSNNRPKASKFPSPPDWQDKNGYVYLIHDGELYKIGMSSQPDRRLEQLQYQDKRNYKLIVMIPSEDYRKLEAELHERFGDKRIKGEWFRLAPEDVSWIASLADTENEE